VAAASAVRRACKTASSVSRPARGLCGEPFDHDAFGAAGGERGDQHAQRGTRVPHGDEPLGGRRAKADRPGDEALGHQ
jgi:hypothetical protein